MLRIYMAALLLGTSIAAQAAAPDLTGLWQAQRIFTAADTRPLVIVELDNQLTADVGGGRYRVKRDGNTLRFGTQQNERFEGTMQAGGDILGHWLQAPSRFDGNAYATPVELRRDAGGWTGEIRPQPDTATFYLLITQQQRELRAALINPERNLGVFQQLSRLTIEGNTVTLLGSFRGRGEPQPMLRGEYHPDEDVLAIRYSNRGGGYDFRRVKPGAAAGFLATVDDGGQTLARPPQRADGWNTASAEAAGVDPEPIRRMIREHILPRPTGPHDLSVLSVLIARHGKLVVEEYFHGFHRDLPHDSRSASKSVTAILAAAAVERVEELNWDSPVYSWFDGDALVAKDARRRDITLRHLLNMSSGLDCDDRNPQSTANEDTLWDNADTLDFYAHTLGAPVVHAAGTVAAYCSASANLVGGVVEAAMGQSLLQVIHTVLAEPLNIGRYAVTVPPDGHPYMGGGVRWLPRDFLKFPQLLLNDGQWNGQQVISSESAARLLTTEVKIDGGRDYGYLWWAVDYPFKDGTVRAHFMAGNGGQIAMLVPELDLSVAFNAGNYSDRVGYKIQEELIPAFILAAVRD